MNNDIDNTLAAQVIVALVIAAIIAAAMVVGRLNW